MPLTALQKDILTILARNRSEESHFAGEIPVALKTAWIEMSDDAEMAMTRIADEQPDLPIGVAFVDAAGKPGWIGDNPSLRPHAPSVRGCWPVIHGL